MFNVHPKAKPLKQIIKIQGIREKSIWLMHPNVLFQGEKLLAGATLSERGAGGQRHPTHQRSRHPCGIPLRDAVRGAESDHAGCAVRGAGDGWRAGILVHGCRTGQMLEASYALIIQPVQSVNERWIREMWDSQLNTHFFYLSLFRYLLEMYCSYFGCKVQV